MNTATIQKLESYRRKVAVLERSLAKESRKLLALPAKYGYASIDAFIAALQKAARAGKAGASQLTKSGKVRRKRAVITAETKAKVKALALAGKTGLEIAQAAGISLPSVANIKRELNLIRKRK